MKHLWVFIIFIVFSGQAQNHKMLADDYFSLGDFNKAIYHLKQIPESKEQQVKLAKSYEQTGNLKSALMHYEMLFGRYPKDILLAYEYSKLLRKTANNKQAEEILSSLIASDSINPNFHYQMGLLKEQQRDSLSITFFENALQLDPNHIPAAIKVATDKIKMNLFDQANTILMQILSVDDIHFQAWNLKALNHFYEKNYHKAIEGYQMLLKINRPSENVHQKLGYAYMQTLQYEKAIENYTIAINEYEDQNPLTHYEIAQAFTALHYFDEAERHLEIAMLLKEPNLDNEYLALMEIYIRKKDFKKNFEISKNAVSHNPESDVFLHKQAVAADNYLKDKNAVLGYYENYMAKFGETGRYRILTSHRINDLKKEIHMARD